MRQIICYTIYGCTKCQKVLNYLNQKDLDVKEINLMENPERADDVIQLTGEVVAPVVKSNTQFVVGDDLKKVEAIVEEINHEEL